MTYYIATANCSIPAIKQLALSVLKMLGSKLALSWCYKTGLYIQMVSRVIIIRGFYLDLLLTFPLCRSDQSRSCNKIIELSIAYKGRE